MSCRLQKSNNTWSTPVLTNSKSWPHHVAVARLKGSWIGLQYYMELTSKRWCCVWRNYFASGKWFVNPCRSRVKSLQSLFCWQKRLRRRCAPSECCESISRNILCLESCVVSWVDIIAITVPTSAPFPVVKSNATWRRKIPNATRRVRTSWNDDRRQTGAGEWSQHDGSPQS